MAEDPVIPKLEDLKRAIVASNKAEAEKNEANESKRSKDLTDKITELSKETPKNIKKITDQQAAVNKKILEEQKKGDKADQEIIDRLTSQSDDLNESLKLAREQNTEDLKQAQATLQFMEDEKANRIPISETRQDLDDRKAAGDLQKKYFEAEGLRAEDNANFREEQFKLQLDELDFRIKNATSPAAKEELKKERRELMNKQTEGLLGLKNAVVNGFKGVADKQIPGLGLRLGDLAKLALIPAFITFLQSDVWQKIKAFIVDPSWTKFGEIIGEYPVLITSLIAIVTGYGLKKIIDVARTATDAFMALKTFMGTTLPTAVKGTYGGAKGFLIKAVELTKAAFTAMKVFLMTTLPTAIKNAYGGGKGFLIKAVTALGVAFTGLKVFLTATLIPSIAAIAAPFLPVIAIVAAVVAGAVAAFYVIKEGIDEFKASLDQGDSLLEAIVKGVTKALGTLITLPITLVKNFVAYLAEKLGFKGIAEKLREFSFADIVTEGLRKIFKIVKDTIFGAVEGIKNLAKKGFSFFKGLFGKEEEVSDVTNSDVTGKQTGGLMAPGQMTVVGEAGAELVMSKSPVQVFNESRTDAIGAAALNTLMTGGGMGGGGNIIAPVSQVQNNTHQSIVRPISNQDPIIDKMTSSLAI